MRNPATYKEQDWDSWYERVETHIRVVPQLTGDLRTSTGAIAAALIATAAATLAEVDEDIIAGEFLSRTVPAWIAAFTSIAVIEALDYLARDLLQAIVEARAALAVKG
jgi:hypothetical protein